MALPVDVIRSRKRKKTVHAEVVDGRIRVLVPAWMSKTDEQEYVAHLVEKLEKRYSSAHIDLARRAHTLATRYDLPLPASITWSDVQQQRWGSCTIQTRAIRISSRLAPWPDWVLDYVIVHELAHLVEANHSPAFHALVNRYPRAERAQGFLIAKSYDSQTGDPTGDPTCDPTGDLTGDPTGDLTGDALGDDVVIVTDTAPTPIPLGPVSSMAPAPAPAPATAPAPVTDAPRGAPRRPPRARVGAASQGALFDG